MPLFWLEVYSKHLPPLSHSRQQGVLGGRLKVSSEWTKSSLASGDRTEDTWGRNVHLAGPHFPRARCELGALDRLVTTANMPALEERSETGGGETDTKQTK